jgi:dTDP-4-dehydrorhamnose 3,5-epimerase
MRIEATDLAGVHVVDMEPTFDERGFSAEIFDREAFAALGLRPHLEHASLAFTPTLGTLRGLRWQMAPSRAARLVRVVRGRVFDVVVDVRAESPSFGCWRGFELSAREGRAVYVPEGCAHGYLTLEDDVFVLHQASERSRPELARHLRWDDPDVGVEWPLAPRVQARAELEAAAWLRDLAPRRVA